MIPRRTPYIKNEVIFLQIDLRRPIFHIALPLLVGGLSALLTRSGMETFTQTVTKPPLTPPPWAFGVVWTLLYLLMGIASYLISRTEAPREQKRRAQLVYLVQLALNFLWPLLFFNAKAYLLALLLLLLLWLAVAWTVYLFAQISKPAALLLVPYLLWLTLAAYLNFGVWRLN